MLAKTISQESRRLFCNGLLGSLIFAYSVYWLYICCCEHWRRAVGCQNLVLLLFQAILVFISLYFLTKRSNKPYHAASLLSLVPGLIVCFINRAARYPDFSQLIATFNSGHPTDPAYLGWASIYTEDFLQYDYIISRSSNASMIMCVLQFIWIVVVLFV